MHPTTMHIILLLLASDHVNCMDICSYIHMYVHRNYLIGKQFEREELQLSLKLGRSVPLSSYCSKHFHSQLLEYTATYSYSYS